MLEAEVGFLLPFTVHNLFTALDVVSLAHLTLSSALSLPAGPVGTDSGAYARDCSSDVRDRERDRQAHRRTVYGKKMREREEWRGDSSANVE